MGDGTGRRGESGVRIAGGMGKGEKTKLRGWGVEIIGEGRVRGREDARVR